MQVAAQVDDEQSIARFLRFCEEAKHEGGVAEHGTVADIDEIPDDPSQDEGDRVRPRPTAKRRP